MFYISSLQGIATPVAMTSDPTPLVWYQFNEGSGTTLANAGSGGSALDAAISGTGTSWVTGYNGTGNALRMTDSGDKATVSANTALNLTTGGTLMMRIKSLSIASPPVWGSPGFTGIQRTTPDGDYTFNLWFDSGVARGFVVVTSGRGDVGYGNSNFTITDWNHITFTYDGVSPQLYLNGTAVGTNRADLTGNFSYTGNNFLSIENANADIDDFRLYSTVLTQAEIAAIASS
jgi:hypothetical protein